MFIETKGQVHSLKEKEAEAVKNKVAFKKALKWAEVKDCNFRVRLRDKFS